MSSEIDDFIAKVTPLKRRRDAETLLALFGRATGLEPELRGTIIGYGEYHYRYDSGREGDFFVIGFSPRKNDISVYLPTGCEGTEPFLLRLGKHKMGKACLSIRQLSDVQQPVLEALLTHAIADHRRRYPPG